MKRQDLETKGLTPEQIDSVMELYGTAIKAEQGKTAAAVDKAVSGLKEQLEQLTAQNGELKSAAEKFSGADATAKAEIARLSDDHKKAMKEMQDKFDFETAKVKREADTKEFFRGIGKKFVTPETEAAFESKLNAALTDKTNEGKNRTDIFARLILGEDNKERTDIFAVADTTKPPAATGGTGSPPQNAQQRTVPYII